MRIQQAIDFYHDLLSGKFLDSTREILEKHNQKLSVAGRPVCSVLRPFFIDESTYEFVRDGSRLVMRGIQTLCQHLKRNPELRAIIDLDEQEEEILKIETGYGPPDVSARLDGFLSAEGEFHFVEYNADSPGGLGYGDALAEIFSQMPIMKAFGEQYHFRTLPVRSYVSDVLLSAFHRWGGSGLPRIAIVDWRNAPTYQEFLLFQTELEHRGCAVKILDPDEIEYRNGRLSAGDFRVDLIYKRVVVGELLTRLGLDHPIARAVRDRAVCCVNGFGVQMAFKKAIFALLSDPQSTNILEDSVIRAVRTHIPWTRKVREAKTEYRDASIDLIPFVSSNKDRFVLKPNGEYGGKGVVLGWECASDVWTKSIQQAVSGSYIVQERVPLGRETYPAIVNGELRFDERYFDLDPYVWDGERVEGCGVRLSKLALLNVSAGGGSATPMFIISPK
jgi:hypothetical protein